MNDRKPTRQELGVAPFPGAACARAIPVAAAVALLLLAGIFGVCEAARAQTVIWSATLEAGSSGAHAGYHRSNNYGSLSSRNFTYKGKSFSVNSIYSSFDVTRMIFAVGGGHVERALFGTSANPRPVTLNIGDGSWMASGSGVNVSGALILIFSEVIAADNTYAVSITTTEPGAPQSLTVTNVTSTGVTLNWSAPNSIGGSAITGYKYRYKASGTSSFGDWTAISNSAGLTSHPVQGLESFTQYTFQILATNDSGDGLYSDEVTATTLRGIPTAILVLDRDRISEDRGESTVTALLDRPSSVATTVTVSASAVPPAMASDFTLSSNKVLTIAAEQTTSTGTVTITAVNNDDDNDNRQVTVSGVAENADGVTQPSSSTLTIVDDESASTTVTLTVSPTSVPEDATGAARTVTVTAELDGDPLPRTTQVTVSVSGDTAVAGTDYTAVPGFTFAIAAGDTSGTGTFTLAPIDDNLDEPDVTVAVTGTTNSGLSVEPESGLTVTIEDDDDAPAVTLVLDPSSIAEDRGASTVTATLDRPSTEDISIAVSASPVSPTEPGDFTLSATKTLTITAGQTTSTGAVTITANDNNVAAPDKSVTVSGAATSEADLTAPPDVTLTIVDDEEASTVVTLTVDRTTVAEDAAAADRMVTVTATLDRTVRAQATPVTVSVSGGTAAAGTDYSAVENFTVTIEANKMSGAATFTLTPVDDEVDEPHKTVVVTGTTTAPGLSVAPAGGVTVTIADDDPRPQATLVLTPATIDEDGGVSTVTATLDRPSSAVTTITVTHARITGTSSSDYGVSDNKVLTIAAGKKASTGTVTFTGKDNDVYQPNARHVVVEGSASNRQGVRHPNNKLLTIREDEVASTKLTLSASPVSVSEGGGDQTVTLTATVDEGARVSGTPVRVSVSGGTAVAGTDYSAVEDFTFRIPPGRTSGTGTFTLTPIDDEADGPDKTVTVIATTPDSVGLPVEPVSGLTITIADDDGAPSGTLALSVDTIASDDTVNIAEKTAGFAISGTTGSEGGVAVSVTIGSQSPLTATSDSNGAWSVSVPADAAYITGTSVAVSVSASKTGFTAPGDVTRTLAVDLAAPSVSYTAPASLKVDVAIAAMTPTTADSDIASYGATGLPSGLTIHAGTGAIGGTPDTAEANSASATVTVTDTAGNPAEVSIAFPTVDKGDQTLTGFAYSTDTVTFGDTAPTVIAPRGAQTALAYAATPSPVCTVDPGTGALTLAGVGACVVTVTAASSDNYNQATASFTVTVQDTLALSVDAKVTLTVSPTSVAEDATGTDRTVTVTATLDGESRSEDTEVTVSVAAGTAVEETDFSAVTNVTVTIAGGATSGTATFDLVPLDDNIDEPDETVIVSGTTTASDLTVEPADGVTLTIEDDEAPPVISLILTPESISENRGASTVTAQLSHPSSGAVRVRAYMLYPHLYDGIVADWSSNRYLTIAAGKTASTGVVTITAIDNEVDNPDSVVPIKGTLSSEVLNRGITFPRAAYLTVVDDDEAPLGTLALSVDTIASDDTVNIAEKTAGFAISGTTGSEGGVAVSVTIGSQSPLTATSDSNGAWSVSVPADAAYITGTSVAVSVSASKTGFTAPGDVTRTLAVDLAAPSVSYTAPASLKVDVAIAAMTPTTADSDIASYGATGLPSGLTIHAGTGAIGGTPDTAEANSASATVTVTDTAGNPAEVSIAFPTVDKGDQTLTGFAYSTDTVTFGDTAPTVIAPGGAQTALAYAATPSSVCTVDPGTGALTLAGVGACVVTVTAASSDNYNQATASFTVTVQDTLALSVDTIASDDTVNIAEKTAGFAISGTTGSEGGVAVSVTIGAQSPLTATSDSNGAWSVNVPADATYIAGTSVAVSVSASKTGFTAPGPVTRTLAVDLAAPSVSYTAPASLKVDVAIAAMTPTTADTDIASYGATGLPSGLTIHAGTGAIGGTPDTAEANSAAVTVTVTDTAGNPAEVSIAFPTVDKGDQTLTGFAYSTDTVTFGDTAPTVIAPSGAQTALAYTATPSSVCTVAPGTGALTLAGVGACVVTVTAASNDNYNQATASFTVTVQDTLALSVDTIASDDTVNIAEKTAGFAISGTTGSEGGVAVSVTIGAQSPLTATSDSNGAWSVNVPADATYIAGTSVAVSVSASKTGFTAPGPVTRTLAVDLAAPSVSYTAPASLKVDVAIAAMTPTTADTDIASYGATGLPSGLTIHAGTGAIGGTPDTAEANSAAVTVTVTDTAGNPAEVSIAFPTVDKGDQTLTGFAYSTDTVTFGDTAPTVIAPGGAQTALAYTATPSSVCTVAPGTGALTLAGVGACVVTVTAASNDNYNQATASFTVTVQDTLALSVDTIASDDTVNIAEKTAGFAISGTTGSEGGVAVSVTIGAQSPLTATSDSNGAWSVNVPADATYIAGTSVAVSVSASKTGFTAPGPVTRTLAVDLAAPSVSYTAPASLKVDVAIAAMTPTTADTDIASYGATGLPSGLTIHAGTGAIGGTPDTAEANSAAVTVTVTDTAGNPAEVSIAFPTVDKGDQTLTGFAYSTDTVTFGDTAPTVIAPGGAQTALAYTATPSSVCTVAPGTGALTLAGVGACVVTVTAASNDNYNQATASFTVTVQDTLALSVDTIASDDTVNIAEKTAGFAISGTTGSEGGVAVSVTIGAQSPLTATSDSNGAWSVNVPADATYIAGTSVAVSVSASKTGFTAPGPVTRTLAVDLAAPSVSYTAPASLKVDVAIAAMTPTTADTDIASYGATGLPSGLTIHAGTGAIGGTPDTAEANSAAVTVTVTDTAGNPAEVSIAFPTVDKGDQTLTGFAYSTDTVTFGDTAPTVIAPGGAQTALAYTATPSSVCTVAPGTGALTLAGVGACVVTVTAASNDNYNQATASFTVTVQDTLALSVDTIASDDTVNIAEKTAGFAISGTTGSEGGVAVSVTIGAQSPLTATSDSNGAWSVNVPADATYIAGTSVAVSVSASKTGFTAPGPVTRTLAVDLAAPSVSYTAPASLKVDVAIAAMTPTTADTDIASYGATGLPSGLTIHAGTGAIGGTPDTAEANSAAVTVTVTDTAGNPAEVSIAFPTVDKGDQTLTGFAYSTDTVTFGDTAPTVIAPSGAQTALAYTATPSSVCTVAPGTGALTLAGVGACVVTVTAASNDNYNQATASFTVTVQDTLLTTPGKPRAPQISSGNGSVIVQWLASSFDGGSPILRYEYCLQPMYRCNNQWVRIPESAPDGANHGRYAITRPNGAYTSLNLRAVNAQGAGPHVNLQAIARAGAPGAPTNLRSEAISAEHVKISWTEPAATTGTTIKGYSLERSRDGVTWAHDAGCQHPCGQQYLGARWEPRGTTSVTVRIGPLYTLLYYRIRTIFETNTPTVVSGINFSQGFSETSPVIEVTTAGGTGSLALPELSVSDGFGHEGPNAAIVFDVSLTGPQRRTSPVTVSYRTQDVTARAGSDYTSRSGTLVFQLDEMEKTVSVPIIDDPVEDSGEEFVLRLSNVSGAYLSRAGGFGTIYNSEDILGGFTLVNAASGTDVGGLDDGATVTLDDPIHGQYGMRAGTVPGTGVNSVRLELSGAKTVTRTDNEAPFTLHAEGGEGLPPGAYTLQATAYSEADGGGNALQTISVTFTVAASTQDEEEGTALSATFPASPYASRQHNGATDRARVVVAFSEAVTAIAANTPSAVVTGGTIASVQAYTEDGLSNAWIFFVTPDGDGDVTFTLAAGAACDNGGICTASGTTLTQVPAARTLPGLGNDGEGTDDSGNTSLTASFSAMPGEHGGPGERFSFELTFSEAPEVGYRKVRDDAFTITGGAVRSARRLERPSNIRWQITVESSGWGDLAISLPGGRACTSSGGLCTSDNRMLANSPSAIVQGPAALSVADANAREGTDATLDFVVTLDRALPLTVTVHYATADGTAAAGADYTATSGTLSFAPGDLAKTVSVPILDDVHDEGSETLTLMLSNATGARIRDAWATGTIENSDPIPKAWLARFGRTVADHVVDAVGERLEGSPDSGSQVTLGGQRIPLDGAGKARDVLAAFADRVSGGGAEDGTAWPRRGVPGGEDAAKGRESRGLTEREMLLGSSFLLAAGGGGANASGLAWAAWGRAAASRFDGNADGLSLDGDVTTFTLGTDAARGRWLGGVALAHSTGEGGFRDHADGDHASRGSGELESTLASVHPYLRFEVSERLSTWGILGYGSGDLTLVVDAAGDNPRKTWKTDTSMWMAAAGARGVIVSAEDTGGFELTARGDARLVRMSSDAAMGADGAGPLRAAEAETSRLRFVLEGSQRIELAGGQTLTPSLEVGLRNDGGDAETGTGIEVGGGIAWADPALGLTVEGKARVLVAHEDADYTEWGASGSVKIDPGASGRGVALTLAPAWGADSGNAERLWGLSDARGLAANDAFEPAGHLEAEAGYGFGAFGGRGLVTPFAGLALSEAEDRTWRGGVRWTLGHDLSFGVEGTLREAANDDAGEHEIGFNLTTRF